MSISGELRNDDVHNGSTLWETDFRSSSEILQNAIWLMPKQRASDPDSFSLFADPDN
jgi:hypothetical protein